MSASRRLALVQSPIIPVVGEMIRAHPGTISLGQGVVHYSPPSQALEAMHGCLADPANHQYGPVDGIKPLKEALANKLTQENGVALTADQCLVVTAGANMAFFNAVLAVADKGDEIILLRPYYFNYEMALGMLGVHCVLVDTDENYQLDAQAVEQAITPKTRAVVTISPNNPTGVVYPENALRSLNALCKRHKIYHISDETYEYFTYESSQNFSPGSIPGSARHTISIFSLSKAYGFASWRIGYMVAPELLRLSLKKCQDTILICPPVISQHAACGALRAGPDFYRPRIEELSRVREVVLNDLSQIKNFCVVPPTTGAFYLLLTVDTKLAPMTLVERLIQEFGVAVIPGLTFGMDHPCTLRIAYGALDRDSVAQGIGRLTRGLESLVLE